jgi:antitoxin CptB
MLQNKEDLKNKIIYRASYRGTKEMDILMIAFVKSLINTLDIDNLIALDKLVNMNDESLISIKKKETIINDNDKNFSYIIKRFQDY